MIALLALGWVRCRVAHMNHSLSRDILTMNEGSHMESQGPGASAMGGRLQIHLDTCPTGETPGTTGGSPENWRMEATTGFEPVIGVLQTLALPLGYVAQRETRVREDGAEDGI